MSLQKTEIENIVNECTEKIINDAINSLCIDGNINSDKQYIDIDNSTGVFSKKDIVSNKLSGRFVDIYNNGCNNVTQILDSRFSNIVFYSMIVGFVAVLPTLVYFN